jgi:hypothetical protein
VSLASFIPLVGPVVDKLIGLIPDPNARAEAEAEYRKALLDATIAESQDQREINRVEAGHRSIFVAGWRPAIGWICVAALAYQYLLRPFALVAAAAWWPDAPDLPTLDDMLWELIFGLLGMGALRSWDKHAGVAK